MWNEGGGFPVMRVMLMAGRSPHRDQRLRERFLPRLHRKKTRELRHRWQSLCTGTPREAEVLTTLAGQGGVCGGKERGHD